MNNILIILLGCVVGIIFGWLGRWLYAKFKLTSVEQRAIRLNEEAIKEAEAKSKELLLETRDQLLKEQQQQEREARERRTELQRLERRLLQKEENLEQKQTDLDGIKKQLGEWEVNLSQQEEEVAEREGNLIVELERIAGLSADEAKALIMESLYNDAKRDAQLMINKIEQEAQLSADKKARGVVVTSIQRLATEVVNDVTVSSVSLPSDEMKGRII